MYIHPYFSHHLKNEEYYGKGREPFRLTGHLRPFPSCFGNWLLMFIITVSTCTLSTFYQTDMVKVQRYKYNYLYADTGVACCSAIQNERKVTDVYESSKKSNCAQNITYNPTKGMHPASGYLYTKIKDRLAQWLTPWLLTTATHVRFPASWECEMVSGHQVGFSPGYSGFSPQKRLHQCRRERDLC